MSTAPSNATSSHNHQPEAGYDVIVVLGYDKGLGAYSSTEFFIQFNNNTSIFKGMFKKEASAESSDDEDYGRESTSSFSRTSSLGRPKSVAVKCNGELRASVPALMLGDRLVFVGADGVYTTSPSSRALEQLGLQGGRNSVSFESVDYNCEVACSVW